MQSSIKSRFFFPTLFALISFPFLPWHFWPFVSVAILLFSARFESGRRRAYFESRILVLFGALAFLTYFDAGIRGLASAGAAVVLALTLLGLLLKTPVSYRRIALLAIGCGSLAAYFAFKEARSVWAILAFFWASNFWSMWIDLEKKPERLRDNLQYYNAPWMVFGLLPVGSSFFAAHEVSGDRDSLRDCQKSGVKLALILDAVLLSLFAFSFWGKSTGAHWSTVTPFKTMIGNEISTWIHQQMLLYFRPWLAQWVTIYLSAVYSCLKILGIYGYCVAVARMFGFAIPLIPFPVNTMTTVSGIYGNLLYYNNKMLVDAFFVPTFKATRKLPSWLHRRFVIFTSVLFGATAFHLTLNLQSIFLFHGFKAFVVRILFFTQYAFLLAAIITFSPKREPETNPLRLFCKFWLSFTVYALILYTDFLFYREGKGWLEVFQTFKVLAGF